MKLKEIVLAGAIFLQSAIAFSQEKLHFDVYSKGEGFLNPRLKNSSLKISPKEIDFSFLFGIYSMEFKKINDSTYQEIVKNNFLWKSKKEFFEYSFKDNCYTFNSYSIEGDKPRLEKKMLEGNSFDEKYKALPELFENFENGSLKDSIHFIVLGLPYSAKIERIEKENNVTYYCNLGDLIKSEPGDIIIFPYPIEAYAAKGNGKLMPLGFSTKFLNVKAGRNVNIEGELKKGN